MKAKMFRFVRHASVFLIGGFLLFFGQIANVPIASAHVFVSHAQTKLTTANSSCSQPSQNVDWMKQSDAQLETYGLPNSAAISENPKLWSRIFAHIKHHSCGSVPNKTTHLLQNNTTCPPGNNSHCHVSENFAGNEATAGTGTYKEADVEFNVPTIPTSPSNAQVAVWAGVGGNSLYAQYPSLVQAGVITSVKYGGQYNESFWEVVPPRGVTPPGGDGPQSLPLANGLHAGDDIIVVVHSNSTSYPNQDAFFIDNVTTGDYNSNHFVNTTNTSWNSDSATAECIVERLYNAGTGTLYPLANFGTERLSSCEAEKNDSSMSYSIGSLPHIYDQIYSDLQGSKLLATVGPISSDGYNYSVTWLASS